MEQCFSQMLEDEKGFRNELKEWMEEARRKNRPSYTITVYCDQHPGVKMILVQQWSFVEYEETSADANTILLWKCPKPGCIRCYEPSMFGYCSHTAKPGSRIQMNPQAQPRGNHPGQPFMYIGKFGEGRRFMCPFYMCNEQGPEVAQAVADEEVEPPRDLLPEMKYPEEKRRLEMSVFQSFAEMSGLPIDQNSAENKDPDYPDILCTISGQKYWFELAQIVNEEVAEKVNSKRRKLDGGFSYNQEKPFVNIIRSKAIKKYVTDGAPLDLILHFDLRFGRTATAQRLAKKHQSLLDSLIRRGPFKRIWIFDTFTSAIVWSKS